MENISKHALAIRKKIITLANMSASPHVGSSLSCVDILSALYFDVMRFENWEERDMFVLSKAHSAMALYCTLTEKGIMGEDTLFGYCKENGTIPAHLDRHTVKGVEVSAGSLGHGFNIGLGIAYGFKKQQKDRNVYVVCGDGEMQEGSIWEGMLFGSSLKLDNFTVLIDFNNLQGYGRPTEVCSFEPLDEKIMAFGWDVETVDGHDHAAIIKAVQNRKEGMPKAVICRTTKGKGVSFMEDQLIWHYYIVTDEHKKTALGELK